jgi:hypothetical protein
VSSLVKLVQCMQRTGTILPAARGKKPYALAEHEATVREPVAVPISPLIKYIGSLLRAISSLDVHRSIASCTDAI